VCKVLCDDFLLDRQQDGVECQSLCGSEAVPHSWRRQLTFNCAVSKVVISHCRI